MSYGVELDSDEAELFDAPLYFRRPSLRGHNMRIYACQPENPTRIPFRTSCYSIVYLYALKPDAAVCLDVLAEVGLSRIRRQRTVLQKLELKKRLYVDFKAERLTP